MRPVLLQGHERSLNQIKYNRDGDLLFSVAKDKVVCGWYTSNGERLGTYTGHQGAVWTVDVSPETRWLATGAADNTVKIWDIKTGDCVKTWENPTAIKRVEFSSDGKRLLAVSEKRMGYLGTIIVYGIPSDDPSTWSDDTEVKITCEDSKATVAGWGPLDQDIISGHEDGSVSKWDSKVRTLPTLLAFSPILKSVFSTSLLGAPSRHSGVLLECSCRCLRVTSLSSLRTLASSQEH